jgi:hypothetical protein
MYSPMQKARGWFDGSPLSTTIASQKTPGLSYCSKAVEQWWAGSSFCVFALPVLSDIVAFPANDQNELLD